MEFLPVSILIGTQFLISGWVKFRGLNTFIDILEKYPLPQIFKNQTFAWLIIIFEILLGVSFLSLQAEMIWFGCLGATFFIICASLLAFIRWLKGEKKSSVVVVNP